MVKDPPVTPKLSSRPKKKPVDDLFSYYDTPTRKVTRTKTSKEVHSSADKKSESEMKLEGVSKATSDVQHLLPRSAVKNVFPVINLHRVKNTPRLVKKHAKSPPTSSPASAKAKAKSGLKPNEPKNKVKIVAKENTKLNKLRISSNVKRKAGVGSNSADKTTSRKTADVKRKGITPRLKVIPLKFNQKPASQKLKAKAVKNLVNFPASKIKAMKMHRNSSPQTLKSKKTRGNEQVLKTGKKIGGLQNSKVKAPKKGMSDLKKVKITAPKSKRSTNLPHSKRLKIKQKLLLHDSDMATVKLPIGITSINNKVFWQPVVMLTRLNSEIKAQFFNGVTESSDHNNYEIIETVGLVKLNRPIDPPVMHDTALVTDQVPSPVVNSTNNNSEKLADGNTVLSSKKSNSRISDTRQSADGGSNVDSEEGKEKCIENEGSSRIRGSSRASSKLTMEKGELLETVQKKKKSTGHKTRDDAENHESSDSKDGNKSKTTEESKKNASKKKSGKEQQVEGNSEPISQQIKSPHKPSKNKVDADQQVSIESANEINSEKSEQEKKGIELKRSKKKLSAKQGESNLDQQKESGNYADMVQQESVDDTEQHMKPVARRTSRTKMVTESVNEDHSRRQKPSRNRKAGVDHREKVQDISETSKDQKIMSSEEKQQGVAKVTVESSNKVTSGVEVQKEEVVEKELKSNKRKSSDRVAAIIKKRKIHDKSSVDISPKKQNQQPEVEKSILTGSEKASSLVSKQRTSNVELSNMNNTDVSSSTAVSLSLDTTCQSFYINSEGCDDMSWGSLSMLALHKKVQNLEAVVDNLQTNINQLSHAVKQKTDEINGLESKLKNYESNKFHCILKNVISEAVEYSSTFKEESTACFIIDLLLGYEQELQRQRAEAEEAKTS